MADANERRHLFERVLDVVAQIPYGRVTTCGQIAAPPARRPRCRWRYASKVYHLHLGSDGQVHYTAEYEVQITVRVSDEAAGRQVERAVRFDVGR